MSLNFWPFRASPSKISPGTGNSKPAGNPPQLLPSKMDPTSMKKDSVDLSSSPLPSSNWILHDMNDYPQQTPNTADSIPAGSPQYNFLKKKHDLLTCLDDFRECLNVTTPESVGVGIVSERPYKDDTIPVSIYQQKLSEKDATIKELKDEVVKREKLCMELQAELHKIKSGAVKPMSYSPPNVYFGEPHEVDKKFRGNTTLDCTNEKVEKQVSEFYGDNGLYTTLMDEAESIGIADLGNLMVSFSKLSYKSAMNVSLRNAYKLLIKLFTHHPEITTAEEAKELEEVQHAYGLLLCCKTQSVVTTENVTKEVDRLLQGNEYAHLNTLMNCVMQGKQKKLFEDFFNETIRQSVQMVSISPPMVMHTQNTFDKTMARPEISKDPRPPILWTQPVIMANWTGKVCANGRADNEESLKRIV